MGKTGWNDVDGGPKLSLRVSWESFEALARCAPGHGSLHWDRLTDAELSMHFTAEQVRAIRAYCATHESLPELVPVRDEVLREERRRVVQTSGMVGPTASESDTVSGT
jgi:hypothetical protein